MKLPGNTNVGVQSLGRLDPAAAMRATQAKGAAFDAAGKALRVYDEAQQNAKIGEAVTRYYEADAQLRSDLTERRTIRVEDIPPAVLGQIDVDDDEQEIEVHRVASQLYDYQERQLRDDLSKGLRGRVNRARFSQAIATRKARTIEVVNQSAIRGQRDALRVQRDNEMNTALRLPDRLDAHEKLEEALNGGYMDGVYTEEEYQKRMDAGRETIDYSHFQNVLMQSEDEDELAAALNEVVMGENFLTTDSVKDLGTRLNAKIDQVVKDREARYEKQRKEQSGQQRIEAMLDMVEGDLYTVGDFAELAETMTPEDLRGLMAWTDKMDTSRNTETATGYNDAAAMIATQVMSGALTKEQAFTQLEAYAGKMNGADYAAAMKAVNDAQRVVVTAPEFQLVEDEIYLEIGRGSKDSIALLNDDGKTARYTSNAIRELYNAAEQGGVGFDARGWWDTNRERLLPPEYFDRAFESYLVNGDNRMIDINASMDKINAAGLPGKDRVLALKYVKRKLAEQEVR